MAIIQSSKRIKVYAINSSNWYLKTTALKKLSKNCIILKINVNCMFVQ